jgi:hypothetical protein
MDLGKTPPHDPGVLSEPDNWYLTMADDEA